MTVILVVSSIVATVSRAAALGAKQVARSMTPAAAIGQQPFLLRGRLQAGERLEAFGGEAQAVGRHGRRLQDAHGVARRAGDAAQALAAGAGGWAAAVDERSSLCVIGVGTDYC